MAWEADRCPRCGSTEGFVRREVYDIQKNLLGEKNPLDRRKKVPVCKSCGRWTYRTDIEKVFST